MTVILVLYTHVECHLGAQHVIVYQWQYMHYQFKTVETLISLGLHLPKSPQKLLSPYYINIVAVLCSPLYSTYTVAYLTTIGHMNIMWLVVMA